MAITRLAGNKRLSAASQFADLVFLSGQTCPGEIADFEDETNRLLEKIDILLGQAGASRSSILHVGVFLSDLRYYETFNALWDAWIDPENIPSRTCVEARLPRKECRVELSVTAAAD